ncbi:hypothetical protein AB7813_08225 [Tardiphaga sp. 20_F10_N6_6]|uniref:hypothetical protein n=1 Tax=Tardiphaga sp. 20_F10_N6_6 TaxID=3240788 RepID=UPI003F8C8A47
MKIDPSLYIPTKQRRDASQRNPQVPPVRSPRIPTVNPVPQPKTMGGLEFGARPEPIFSRRDLAVLGILGVIVVALSVVAAFA